MKGYIIDTEYGDIVKVYPTVGGARRGLTARIRAEKRSSYPNTRYVERLAVVDEVEYRLRWESFGDELVDTVNMLTGQTLQIPRRQKGTHMDPSQERYHSS